MSLFVTCPYPFILTSCAHRRLCELVTQASSLVPPRGSHQRRDTDRSDFDRLNNIEKDVADSVFDLRVIREDAQREALAGGQVALQSNKRMPRPFQKLVIAQQEKLKRDRYWREKLSREKRHEQQKLERREEDLNRAMEMRRTGGVAHKQHRSKRSMSAFFRVIRPISTAFTSESVVPGPKKSAAELDFNPTQKPAMVLSLVDARVFAFINNERSFTFQLDTDDGGHYLLQATSRAEMTQWINTIQDTARSYAQRRLTYLGDAPKPELGDHFHVRPPTASHDPTAGASYSSALSKVCSYSYSIWCRA